jgi:hypothetical protein
MRQTRATWAFKLGHECPRMNTRRWLFGGRRRRIETQMERTPLLYSC